MEYPENEILTLGAGRAETHSTIHSEKLRSLTESSENKTSQSQHTLQNKQLVL